MRTLRRLLARLTGPLHRRSHEQRMQEEFKQHVELLAEDLIRSGMTPAEARRQAAL